MEQIRHLEPAITGIVNPIEIWRRRSCSRRVACR